MNAVDYAVRSNLWCLLTLPPDWQPFKSLHLQLCYFDDSVQRMTAEARAQQRLLTSWQQRRRWLASP